MFVKGLIKHKRVGYKHDFINLYIHFCVVSSPHLYMFLKKNKACIKPLWTLVIDEELHVHMFIEFSEDIGTSMIIQGTVVSEKFYIIIVKSLE